MATLPKPTTPTPPADGDKTVFQNSPGVSPVKLGGKSIPVPANKVAQAPSSKSASLAGSPVSAPSPVAQPQVPSAPLPRAGAPGAEAPQASGINPALAPKPATPLTPPSSSAGATPSSSPKPVAGQAPAPANTTTPLKAPFTKQPVFAQIQANPKKWLLIIGGGLIAIILLFSLISRIFNRRPAQVAQDGTVAPTEQVVLTYWGLWEPSAVLESVIAEYEEAHPGVKIDYRVQSHRDYRERLQTAIASGNGPDVFRYHASWVPMLSADLAVLPASVMSANEFQNTFFPVASQQLQVEGRIVGIPLMYDGLTLYYNKDILQTAGVSVPDTWAELKQLANELTVPADKNERRSGGIQRAGLAIGNATNVDHFSDILGLLISQNGGTPAEPSLTEVRDALVFYTNFITQDVVWSASLPSSTVAFARGDVAMMFAPSWRAHEIQAMNPQLNFATAPLPQLSDQTVAWANYWAEGVNERSTKKTEAWQFLQYLSTAEVMQKLYSAQAQVRAFGEPYSRRDLAQDMLEDPFIGPLFQQADSASWWFMSSATHDNGLNDNITDYYATAVNGILDGNDVEEVLPALGRGVQQELRQYGISQ